MQKLLTERAASTLTRTGNRWKATLAVGGQQGSSGYYSEDVLREFGPAALPAGSKAFINHDPKRDPRDMFGFYPDGARYEEGVGLVGELEVFPHYKELVENIAEHAALSIYMMGEADDEGNITALLPNRLNTVDLVSYGGLEGSAITQKLYESAIAAQEERTAIVAGEEDEGMTKEELQAALAEALAPVLAFVSSKKTAEESAAQAAVDAAAIESAVESAVASFAERAAAIEAAELLPSQREALLADARKGIDTATALEAAAKIAEEAKAAFASEDDNADVAVGRVHESAEIKSGAKVAESIVGW